MNPTDAIHWHAAQTKLKTGEPLTDDEREVIAFYGGTRSKQKIVPKTPSRRGVLVKDMTGQLHTTSCERQPVRHSKPFAIRRTS